VSVEIADASPLRSRRGCASELCEVPLQNAVLENRRGLLVLGEELGVRCHTGTLSGGVVVCGGHATAYPSVCDEPAAMFTPLRPVGTEVAQLVRERWPPSSPSYR